MLSVLCKFEMVDTTPVQANRPSRLDAQRFGSVEFRGLKNTRKRERRGTAAVIMAASFMLTVGAGLLFAGWLRIEGIL